MKICYSYLLVVNITMLLSVKAFVPTRLSHTTSPATAGSTTQLQSSARSINSITDLKSSLVKLCQKDTKPSLSQVTQIVNELEAIAKEQRKGQDSAVSGLLSGEWELIYSPEDATRSSPFFWAFRKAFPDNSDQIFAITDSIPAPLKEIGPATQSISLNVATETGRFTSRVKVATLGGMATSMMTTKAAITGIEGTDTIKLKVESTKPEESTILEKLGPFGRTISESAPPFPSGEALEQVQPGSSEVTMKTTFCDEGIRISRNGDRMKDIFVWRRKAFDAYPSM